MGVKAGVSSCSLAAESGGVGALALLFGIRGLLGELMIRSDRQTHGDVSVDRGKDPIELLHPPCAPWAVTVLAGLCFVSSDV